MAQRGNIIYFCDKVGNYFVLTLNHSDWFLLDGFKQFVSTTYGENHGAFDFYWTDPQGNTAFFQSGTGLKRIFRTCRARQNGGTVILRAWPVPIRVGSNFIKTEVKTENFIKTEVKTENFIETEVKTEN